MKTDKSKNMEDKDTGGGDQQQLEMVALAEKETTIDTDILTTNVPDPSKDSEDTLPSLTYRVVKTIILVSMWIAFGLFLEATGPTLIDLKLRSHSSYEAIARAVSGRSFGEFVGAVFGGFLVDKLTPYVDAVIAVCMAISAVANFCIPFVPKVELLWFCVLILGIMSVIVNICANRMILHLWREKASSPMYAMHSGFGIGSFIVPLIANPFLAVTERINLHNCSNISMTGNNSDIHYFVTDTIRMPNNSNFRIECDEIPFVRGGYDSLKVIVESTIEYAFGIVSIPPICLAITFFLYQFCFYHPIPRPKPRSTKSERGTIKKNLDLVNPATCAGGDFWCGLCIFALVFLHFFGAIGGERLCAKFVRAFAIDNYHFSNSDGSYANTAFWISFFVGRISGFILGKFIVIRTMLLIEITGLSISTIILAVFGEAQPLIYWIFMQPVGFFIGQLYPTGMTWADYHVELTGVGIMTCSLGGGIGGVSFLFILGHFYDRVGPKAFLYQLFAFSCFAFIVGFSLHFIGHAHGSRFDKVINQRRLSKSSRRPSKDSRRPSKDSRRLSKEARRPSKVKTAESQNTRKPSKIKNDDSQSAAKLLE